MIDNGNTVWLTQVEAGEILAQLKELFKFDTRLPNSVRFDHWEGGRDVWLLAVGSPCPSFKCTGKLKSIPAASNETEAFGCTKCLARMGFDHKLKTRIGEEH
jgi:hypothetical protein